MAIFRLFILAFLVISGCIPMTPPPQWNQFSGEAEREYQPYLAGGTGSLIGQAFLTQRNGGVVKASGRTVTIDPATSIGIEWWEKAGKIWEHRLMVPPSVGFKTARKMTIADADGKFKFLGLAAGKYFVRTEVTWEVPGYYIHQGGLVGALIDIRDGHQEEIILNQLTN